MSRPRNPDRPSRARQPLDIPPFFARPNDFTRLTGITEGHARQLEARGIAPRPVRIEGSRIVLRDVAEWVNFLKRSAA
jgi:hypothetical protein